MPVGVHVRTVVDVNVMVPLGVGVALRDKRGDGLGVLERDAAVEDIERRRVTLRE